MWLPEPIRKDAVFHYAVHYAIRPNNRSVDRARENQGSYEHNKCMKGQLEPKGPGQEHGYARYQVIEIVTPLAVRDNHNGEERHRTRKHEAKDKNDEGRPPEVAELGGRNLAVDLRQALL